MSMMSAISSLSFRMEFRRFCAGGFLGLGARVNLGLPEEIKLPTGIDEKLELVDVGYNRRGI